MCFVVLCLLVRAYYPVPQGWERRRNLEYQRVFMMRLRDGQYTDATQVYGLLTEKVRYNIYLVLIEAASTHPYNSRQQGALELIVRPPRT